MKIAFVLDRFPALTQTFVLNQLIGTIEAGHQVDIYAMAKGSLEKVDRRVLSFGLDRKVRHIRSAPGPYVQRLIAFTKLFSRHFLHHPALVLRCLNGLYFGRKAFSLKLFFKATAFLEGMRHYDIIHCQFGMLGNEILDLRKLGVINGKLVTSFRGYDTEKYLRRNPGAYNRLIEEGDLFLPVCESFARWLQQQGCPREKIRVLYSGIDCRMFRFKPRKKKQGEPVRLLTVARLVPKKGVEYAIEAVAALAESGLDLQYTIVGDGPQRARLEDMIAARALKSKVHLAGWQDRPRVLEYMQGAHILLAPSVTASDGDCEGIPNVIKEAMAMGMPVVSTRHSGIPELVEDGVCGFLAEQGNSVEFKHCLETLIRNESHWEEYGHRGRKIIEERFDIGKLNCQLLEYYSRLVSGTLFDPCHCQLEAEAA